MYETLLIPCFISSPHSCTYQAPDWNLASEFRVPLSCFRWEFVCTPFAWQVTVPITLFWELLTGTEWAIEFIIASALSKGLKKFVLGTPNGILVGSALQLRQFSLSSRLQVFRCELFELFSVIESIRGKYHRPLVRFKLPSYSAVSLCIHPWDRCEWRTTKRISYWRSCRRSRSTLEEIARQFQSFLPWLGSLQS